MGLLSDRQIKSRCMQPSHFLAENGKWIPVIAGVTHSAEQLDNWIRRGYSRLRVVKKGEDLEAAVGWKPMITPFVEEAVRYHKVKATKQHLAQTAEGSPELVQGELVRDQKIISYGLSSYGYDVRIKREGVKLFTNLSGQAVDPMRPYDGELVDPIIRWDEEFGLEYFLLPPNSVALAHTVEYFRIPRDVLVMCIGKSTYARVGLSQLMTPLEPEWEGELVLEIASMTNLPTRVYLGCGVAQLVFLLGDEVCEVSYKDRGGKYQGQTGTTLARI